MAIKSTLASTKPSFVLYKIPTLFYKYFFFLKTNMLDRLIALRRYFGTFGISRYLFLDEKVNNQM